MQKLLHFSTYLQQKYGMALQRIPLDLALGCPNRKDGFGPGCIFCAEDGARARHLVRTAQLDLTCQVRTGREYVLRRYQSTGPYIAYFQAFTSTFALVSRLRELYEPVLAEADFRMVIVSTRPDALPEPVLDYLEELATRYELWVELGIQSANDLTLNEIHRGHTFAQVADACARLKARNIPIAGHFILGLPGETLTDWCRTAELAAELPLSALKIHQLMVLKHTELAQRMAENAAYVHPLNEYEYAAGLKAFLERQPEGRLLMRLTAEADEKNLIAPRWWMKKGQFLQFFEDYFYKRSGAAGGAFIPTVTADGSFTLYHPQYHQHFHSLAGAQSEAMAKFAEPSHLIERLAQSAENGQAVRLLDVGFGLGGNVFAALDVLQDAPQGARLEIVSLEFDERTLAAAQGLYQPDRREWQILEALKTRHWWQGEGATVRLLLDDARRSIQTQPDGFFDLIWLDAFSPDSNPELWSVDFFRECRRVLETKQGRLLTYSGAAQIRGGLLKNKFHVAETPPFGRKRGGTIAGLTVPEDAIPLSDKERHIILDSTAGVPYFDPGLHQTCAWILTHRKKLVDFLRCHNVPKWYRERGN